MLNLYQMTTRQAVLANWSAKHEIARFTDEVSSYEMVLFNKNGFIQGFCFIDELATRRSSTLETPFFATPSTVWIGHDNESVDDQHYLPKELEAMLKRQGDCYFFLKAEGEQYLYLGRIRPVLSINSEIADMYVTLVKYELSPALPGHLWQQYAGPQAWVCLPEPLPVDLDNLKKMASENDAMPFMRSNGDALRIYGNKRRLHLEFLAAGDIYGTIFSSDPAITSVSATSQEFEEFSLDNGEDYPVHKAFTVPYEDGLRALEQFIRTGELANYVRWTTHPPLKNFESKAITFQPTDGSNRQSSPASPGISTDEMLKLPQLLPESWRAILADEFSKPYFQKLEKFVTDETSRHTIYPPREHLFAAFRHTGFDDVTVLLLGQDPYHNEGQAHGLSFSVQPGVPLPPSLKNIFKEMEADLGSKPPNNGCLIPWARQGVLLLNAVLTVRAGEAASHKNQGWEIFTDSVITKLSARDKPLVFLLWGDYARKKRKLIDEERHVVIESAHPSPLSARAGFFGSRPFSKINTALKKLGYTPIDWQLPNI